MFREGRVDWFGYAIEAIAIICGFLVCAGIFLSLMFAMLNVGYGCTVVNDISSSWEPSNLYTKLVAGCKNADDSLLALSIFFLLNAVTLGTLVYMFVEGVLRRAKVALSKA